MNKIVIILSLLFCFFQMEASEKLFVVSQIPQELIKGAAAVIQYDSTYLELTDKGVIRKSKRAITILNEKGRYWATFNEVYTNFSKLSNISGKLLNANGDQIGTLNKKKVIDISTFGNSFTFHDDVRVKSFSFDHHIYPYTVVYEFTSTSNYNFSVPGWDIQPSEQLSVLYSVFCLSREKRIQAQQKFYNKPASLILQEEETENTIITKWSVSDIKAFYPERALPSGIHVPYMALAAEQLHLAGFKGSSNSWESFGKFFYEINQDRDQLPADAITAVKNMTDTIRETKDKIALLYRYLQNNTRYLANEYGLAGWQTFPASDVFKNGYGDCKGLSNYMKALLKAIDIKSHLVLVSAGEQFKKMDPSFVSNSFNHMILCVPQGKDTIWLECTSTNNLPGYLGTFTQNRSVLLLTENGGVVATTPHYDKTKSYIQRNAGIWLNDQNGHNRVIWNTEYAGIAQEDLRPAYLSIGSEKQLRDRLIKIVPYQDFKIERQQYEANITAFEIPKISEEVTLNTGNFISDMSGRLYVQIPIKTDPFEDIEQLFGTRTQPFELKKDRTIKYQFTVHLPDGYKLAAPLHYENIQKPFGDLHWNIKSNTENILNIEIIYNQNSGVYDAELFSDFKIFTSTIHQYLSTLSFVLKKL